MWTLPSGPTIFSSQSSPISPRPDVGNAVAAGHWSSSEGRILLEAEQVVHRTMGEGDVPVVVAGIVPATAQVLLQRGVQRVADEAALGVLERDRRNQDRPPRRCPRRPQASRYRTRLW